jgi:hypothetical protein
MRIVTDAVRAWTRCRPQVRSAADFHLHRGHQPLSGKTARRQRRRRVASSRGSRATNWCRAPAKISAAYSCLRAPVRVPRAGASSLPRGGRPDRPAAAIDFTRARAKEAVSRSCRIRSCVDARRRSREASWEKSAEALGESLHAALAREKNPGAGMESLKQVWQSPKLPPLLREPRPPQPGPGPVEKGASRKSGRASDARPQSLSGIFRSRLSIGDSLAISPEGFEGFRSSRARAAKHGNGVCRQRRRGVPTASSWLLGTIYEQIGRGAAGYVACFLPGILRRPAFPASVAAILRHRDSRAFAPGSCRARCASRCGGSPCYLDPVFDFFLRAPGVRARRAGCCAPCRFPNAGPRRAAGAAFRGGNAPVRARSASATLPERPGIIVEGPFLTVSGHARINRALGCFLLDSPEFDAALEPSEPGTGAARVLPDRARIVEGLARRPARMDLTIRHFWPPDFRRPAAGRLASMLPWEHRAVPRAWVREIERWVDELWVPSRFVAEALIESGVTRGRVEVIPHGFDPRVFHPQVKPWRPAGCRGCMFLFVGGTIRRKGADLLVQAYADTFSSSDDVTLVLKDTGASSFYRHNNLLPEIRNMRRRAKAPHILPPHRRTRRCEDRIALSRLRRAGASLSRRGFRHAAH